MGVAGHAPLHDLSEGGQERARLLGGNDARQRLLDEFVRAEAEEREHRVVGLQDLPFKITAAHGIYTLSLHAALPIYHLLVLAHVAQDPDAADHLAVRVA